ncbi:MAG: histidine phosphatase family protein [Chloroflexi bacterium]|nr:histidine phosphatase family protein [Chloroflexota bacterium]
MQLFIIRHAQSTNNALPDQKNRVQDPPLTELGLQQADKLAQHLFDGPNFDPWIDPRSGFGGAVGKTGHEITHLYCSAMHRSLQTAQPVAKVFGIQPEVWLPIHEHGGIFLEENGREVGYPGMTRAEIQAAFPNYILPEAITDKGWWLQPGGETLAAAYGRAIYVAEELRRRARDEADACIALISHGTFIDGLIKALLNQLPNRQSYFLHYNTAITRADFDANGRMIIRHTNRVDHLPDNLIS